jgi:hypothetical protein
MTFAPEPADDIAAPRDPASYGPPRHLFSRGFVVVMLFGLFCILAGAAFTLFIPKLFPPRADSPAPAAAAPAPAARADLQPAAPVPLQGSAATAPPDLTSLQERVSALETGQGRAIDAAAASLAASALAEAAQTSRPFAGELAALERVLPLSADLRDLRRLAETGAPTRAALAAAFDPAAAKASVAAHEPGPKAGFLTRLLYLFSSIVVVRRVDDVNGNGADAILARAGRQAAEGDLEGALDTLRALSPKAQAAFADWRAKAEARVEIDRRVAAVREAALGDLMQSIRGR